MRDDLGSFKIRGIGLACQALYLVIGRQRGHCGGVCGAAAGGAGGRGDARDHHQASHGLDPQQNAEVIVHGASWLEANTLAQSMVTAIDAFLHPFDDPLLWQGHASLIDEVARSGVKPGLVVLSVGGGGLLCGVAEGFQRNGWGDVRVLAVETHGADSFAQAMQAKERITLPAITSLATSLGARRCASRRLTSAASAPFTAPWCPTGPPYRPACSLPTTTAWWWSPPAARRWPRCMSDYPRWMRSARCWWWCVAATLEQLQAWTVNLPASAPSICVIGRSPDHSDRRR
jgi:Pyridoxal-phosphate dependent enzyme